MPTRKVFNDEHGNEMDCYINDKDQVFLSVGDQDTHVDQRNWITLDIQDVDELIKILKKYRDELM